MPAEKHERMGAVLVLNISLLPLMTSAGMMYSVLPLYLSELGAGRIAIGLLFTAGAATGAASSIFIGKLADRYGRAPLILFAQVCFAAVMLLYSTIVYYTQALPLHILEGFGWAMLGVATPALITDMTDRRRGEALGIYNAMWNFGWVVGPALGGVLAELFGFKVMLRVAFLMIALGIAATIYVFSKEDVKI
ncbi:MFS transporter [Archaeoglobus veneficus]|uniref:Major facilitator superfamily MFS_1 n=1 Tax=Archaeoglobus veneficus (strain DSM 11195 / SNP6) TaxID=693661 RepID=F2KSL8_ARCVS|nr:MFS transporter [Archaeoglobus veneficus]AEA48088.1 major facilitator superfamily MFS_1 [Archaeoglobus veneficus SNP6]